MVKIQKNYEGRVSILPVFKDQPVLSEHQELLDQLIATGLFTGEKNTFYHMTIQHDGLKHLLFMGLGTIEGNFQETLRQSIGNACRKAARLKETECGIQITDRLMEKASLESIATGAVLSQYAFDKYLSQKKGAPLSSIVLYGKDLEGRVDFDVAVEEGIVMGEMTNLSRTLANEPGEVIHPEALADRAKELGKRQGFKVKIHDRKKIEKLGMHAFLAVAQGSAFEPRLIVMEYNGGGEGPLLGLVGKGITFDSGGLSLKPASSMMTMQGDMSGAASVIAAMGAIARMELPVHVVAVVAACENAVSGASYRPNDIISSRSGKSIFISNTDAEGRLTLIDALDYILTEKKVDRVVDIATLTGAAEVALGQKIAAVITNHDGFMDELKTASKETGERVWELPHDDDFLKLIESPYADLNNSGGRFGGTITAGLFLGSVVGDTPWLHIDIAGPSWSDKEEGYLAKGATGYGTRLLYRLVKNTLH